MERALSTEKLNTQMDMAMTIELWSKKLYYNSQDLVNDCMLPYFLSLFLTQDRPEEAKFSP